MYHEVDVAIIGGAFAGASTALLLKRQIPDAKVLIIERTTQPDRKVGESTSEVAGCFISRVLGLYHHLMHQHVPKHGLRMWFTTPENECMGACGEIGPYYQSRMGTFQIDRAVLDPHILEQAVKAGCELWKPARVAELELGGLGQNILTVKMGEEVRTVKAKWIVDASGRAAMIARQRKTWRKLEEHPTNSIWARFRGCKDLDCHEFHARFPEYAKAVPICRDVATNHLMGRGWWCWIIPLKDGDVSVGVTYDSRLYTPPEGKTLTERLHKHLMMHPVGRELFQNAVAVEKDTRTYSHLPYYSKEVAGDGWLCVGDAAGFMDPLYSQGLDYCGHMAVIASDILADDLKGRPVGEKLHELNRQFPTSYFRWWNALYKDKYHYLGDLELMWPAFLMDIGTYFIGPVRLVYQFGDVEWKRLPYYGLGGRIFGGFMRFYNRRLAAIGQKRWAAGCYGRNNLHMRKFPKQGFSPNFQSFALLRKGVWAWLKCEWHALWLRPKPEMKKAPMEPSKAAVNVPVEMPALVTNE